MTKLRRKITSIYLTVQPRLVKKKIINFFQWVRSLHLDDEDRNLDLRITAHVREIGVDVERVLFEEVHTDSFSQDMKDSFI